MATNGPPNSTPVRVQPAWPHVPPGRRTSWPVTFGTAAILLGVLGIMSSLPAGCAGGLTSTLLPAGATDAATTEAIRGMSRWFVVGSLVSTVLSAMLLVIGVGLCQRRAWSLRLMWTWSVLNLGITVVAAVAGYILSRKLLAGMQAHGQDLMMSISSSDVASMSLWIAIAILVVGWSSPVFLLIWLARPTIRQETAQWR